MRSTMRMLGLVTPAMLAGAGLAHAQSRPDVNGTEAAVVAGHPLAAAAGADVLRRGGNAIDAAVTMAAVLAVVRPHMNGVGGDAFLLIHEARTGRVHALNGSGRAGSLATPEGFRERGLDRVPNTGIHSVTVPGAVRAWADALRRFGTISLEAALAPAIHYAEAGFPVSRVLAEDIASSRRTIEGDAPLAAVFLRGGRPPEVGSLLRQTDLAATLRTLAERGPDALYRGEIGQRIARFLRDENGFITLSDLEQHTSTWQEPIWTDYLGYRIGAFPPNTQGIAMLMQMNMAERFELRDMGHNSAQYVKTLAGITRIAFQERDRFVTDPAFVDVPVDRMLSKDYARRLVSGIASPREEPGVSIRHGDGDTVYLCVIDRDGNAVSMIQSLFNAFGSGRMVPGTGILLHNRGGLFELDPAHVNVVAPGKRTYHTLAPAIALHSDGSPFLLFGTPGGDGQTQTLIQVFNSLVMFGMSPQQAIEAPRWRFTAPDRMLLEPGFPQDVQAVLVAAGLDVSFTDGLSSAMGNAQLIMINRQPRILRTGADMRREGYAIAW